MITNLDFSEVDILVDRIKPLSSMFAEFIGCMPPYFKTCLGLIVAGSFIRIVYNAFKG